MKFRKFGQRVLASAISLAVGMGLSACGGGTSDFLYVTASKNNPGQIAVFKVDRQSGVLTALQSPVYPSGASGRNPVALAISPNEKYLFVVNHDTNEVVAFAIGTDGKLYPQSTVNTPGTFPTSVAVDPAGKFLYVVDNYQPGYTDSVPGPGGVVVYPLDANQTLPQGTAPLANGGLSYYPVGLNPAAMAVLPAGTSLYVVNKGNNSTIPGDAAICLANAASCGTISAFNISSTGALAQLAASTSCNGAVCAGTAPSAIAVHPDGSYVYITDSAANQLMTYSVQATGALMTPATTVATGNLPDGLTVDPDGRYLYVVNYVDNSLSAYAVSAAAGATTEGIPKAIGTTFTTGARPTCVIVEPSVRRYLYTSNFIDSTVSGFQIDTTSGALTPIQNTPYPIPGGAGQPTCIGVITHGKRPAKIA